MVSLDEEVEQKDRSTLFIGGVITVTFVVVFLGGILGVGAYYKDRVLPGIHVGTVGFGGMSEPEVRDFLESMSQSFFDSGVPIRITTDSIEKEVLLPSVVVAGGDAIDIISVNIDAETTALLGRKSKELVFVRGVRALKSAVERPAYTLHNLDINEKQLRLLLEEEIKSLGAEPSDANIRVASVHPFSYEILPAHAGITFAIEEIPTQIRTAWGTLTKTSTHLVGQMKEPRVTEVQARELAESLRGVTDLSDITITYYDDIIDRDLEWVMPWNTIIRTAEIAIDANGTAALHVSPSGTHTYLEETIAPIVNDEPREALFSMEDGRVTAFQSSRNGRGVAYATTTALLDTVFTLRLAGLSVSSTISLATEAVAPRISSTEVNDFGIVELLGSGHSSFKGSPSNRVKNIKNGAKKLNGVLIKPGEEFSTITYTQPYTLEGGYLPELVIKGSKITPEIGGGLCQIGTTLFRMAMNSGMDITERQNHSLVVSYYNDLKNGNPGTDATIYEPAPDFKFKNDTDHYILVQAEVRESTGDLIFSLWGTKDGREGSYSAPEVKRWIPYGETKNIESTTLKPGEKTCQKAYRGAETAFTYTRVMPNGEKIDRVFTSYYRPLPQICLVGATETPTPIESGTEPGIEGAEPVQAPEMTSPESVPLIP